MLEDGVTSVRQRRTDVGSVRARSLERRGRWAVGGDAQDVTHEVLVVLYLFTGVYFPQKYWGQDVHSSPEQLSFRPKQIGLRERAQKTTLMKCLPSILNTLHTPVLL